MSLRQQNKARVRASILEAAQALIVAQGIDQTTTRQIAQQAGVSYQTLYNYFPSKSSLLHGILADDIQAWGADIDASIKQYRGDLLATLTEINQISLDQFGGERFGSMARDQRHHVQPGIRRQRDYRAQPGGP